MDQVKQLVDSVAELWGYIAAVFGVAIGCYKYGGRVYASVMGVYRLSSGIHKHYGAEPWKKIIELEGLNSISVRIGELRSLLIENHLGLAVFICQPTGECESANEQLAELFGLDHSEFTGYGWLAGIVPEDRERVHRNWTYCVINKLPYSADYTVENMRTGQKVKCTAKSYPVFFDGKVVRYVGTVTRNDRQN